MPAAVGWRALEGLRRRKSKAQGGRRRRRIRGPGESDIRGPGRGATSFIFRIAQAGDKSNNHRKSPVGGCELGQGWQRILTVYITNN